MNKNKYFLIMFLSVYVILLTGCGTQTTNYECTDEVIESIGNLQEGEIELSSITSFQWDEVYVFKPYTSKDGVKEAIGCKPKEYRTTVSETDTLMYFLKEQEIVCCVIGSFDDLGFYMNYNFDDYYDKLDNSAVIKVEITDDGKSIELIK